MQENPQHVAFQLCPLPKFSATGKKQFFFKKHTFRERVHFLSSILVQFYIDQFFSTAFDWFVVLVQLNHHHHRECTPDTTSGKILFAFHAFILGERKKAKQLSTFFFSLRIFSLWHGKHFDSENETFENIYSRNNVPTGTTVIIETWKLFYVRDKQHLKSVLYFLVLSYLWLH